MNIKEPLKKSGRVWFKVLAYPYVRSATDISQSLKGIRQSWEQAEEIKRQKQADGQAVREFLGDKSAKEKFEEIYRINRWTDAELKEQAIAARRTRLGSLFMIAALLPLLIWTMSAAPLWVRMITALVCMVVFAAFAAQAARFAWWEAQIEERSCFPMREFLSRDDLISRVFRWRKG